MSLDLHLKNWETPPKKIFINDPPKLELKTHPYHLCYMFFGQNKTLQVIIIAALNNWKVEALISMLKHFKRAIDGWLLRLLVFHYVYYLIKSNSFLIVNKLLSTREDWIHQGMKLPRRRL